MTVEIGALFFHEGVGVVGGGWGGGLQGQRESG